MIYIVPFDDEELKPWAKIFSANSLEKVEDKIIDYIYNTYDFEDQKMPTEYNAFVKACRKNNIYIGKIKESEELA